MAPEDETMGDLPGLDEIMKHLEGYLSPQSIPRWLHGSNAHLGSRRPISVLREGRVDEVIAAIDAEKGGSYA